MADQWYTDPAVGYTAQISAMAQPVMMVKKAQISHPYMAVVGPPVEIKSPQLVEMEVSTPTAVKQNAKFISGPVKPRSAEGAAGAKG